jgi:hypothetical protein
MRRAFQLPEEDVEYVEGLGLPWETVKDGDTRWLVVHNWPVPPGYNHPTAMAGLILPASYPDGQITCLRQGHWSTYASTVRWQGMAAMVAAPHGSESVAGWRR